MSEDKLYTLIASLYKRGMSVVTAYSIRACSSSANCSTISCNMEVGLSSMLAGNSLQQIAMCSAKYD